MIERQTIVTWHTPDERKPPEGDIVVVSISGRQSANVTFDHAFALAEWYDDGEGWTLSDIEMESFTVHAWCDLMPYGGGLPSAQPKSEERTAESTQNVPNDEPISKKAAIDCVKASPINGWVKEDLIQALETAPSAQPEIIRCKECKHAKITADGKYMKYCSQWDVDDALYLDSGFFCGHAERRTDEPKR